jgi:hypothetical protein
MLTTAQTKLGVLTASFVHALCRCYVALQGAATAAYTAYGSIANYTLVSGLG